MKKRLISSTIIIIFLLVCFVFLPMPLTLGSNTKVHLSFDDVVFCFSDLSENKDKYNSLFDNDFLHSLKELHDKYGCKFTLYTYAEVSNGYRIEDMSDKYKKDFEDNSDWLKIGFHAANPSISKDSIAITKSFEKAFIRVNNEIKRFAGVKSISTILRLHYFYATAEEADFLTMNGVQVLLSADDDRESYSLGDLNKDLLSREIISTKNIIYETTDIRIEKTTFPNIALVKNQKEPALIIFTHEWAFSKLNKIKLDYLIWRLSFENVKYIN